MMPDILKTNPRAFLEQLFHAAVAASHPRAAMQALLPPPPRGRTIVVGAGKAAGPMAEALESLWPGPLEGTVVSRHGTSANLRRIEFLTAAHPVPDAAGLAAAERLLANVANLTADDLVIALISGGGSALLPAPVPGLTLQDEMNLNTALLRSGAPIAAMNGIRKHISRIKGGRLAQAAFPARVASFVVSDIPGDNLALVSSGPTIADDVTVEDAKRLIRAYDISIPPHIIAAMQPAPAPHDAQFAGHTVHLVASAARALEAAAAMARAAGLDTYVLSDAIEGESREVAKMHANIARFVQQQSQPFAPPCLILSGGETTVTIGAEGHGKGGRNSEFLLSFACEISGLHGIHALAADSDGIDGSEDNAGGFVDCSTWDNIRKQGLDPAAQLKHHDAWTALNAAGSLFTTGPTGTNVNDIRAILVL